MDGAPCEGTRELVCDVGDLRLRRAKWIMRQRIEISICSIDDDIHLLLPSEIYQGGTL